MEITVDILKAIAPGSKKTNYKHLPGLALWMNHWFPMFEIDALQELRHMLTQLAHESDSFNAMEEYASGKAYEGRKDLGNTRPGDGIKFKGHGPIQITGKTNHSLMGIKAGAPLKFINDPKLLCTYEWGIWAACIFWTDRGLIDISNMPDDAVIWSKRFNRNLSPLEYITMKINGAFNGYSERLKFYERCKGVIQ
jgi:putative chitinase